MKVKFTEGFKLCMSLAKLADKFDITASRTLPQRDYELDVSGDWPCAGVGKVSLTGVLRMPFANVPAGFKPVVESLELNIKKNEMTFHIGLEVDPESSAKLALQKRAT